MFSKASNKSKAIIAVTIAFASLNAEAALTSYNSNGVGLVYSSVSDATWTKDGSLLGSMIASQGYAHIVNAIINASPTINNTPNIYSPTGTYTLTITDFRPSGSTNWFGAIAFINYLNSITYGGSGQWRLPTVIDIGKPACNDQFDGTDECGYNVSTNGIIIGDELAELYQTELGSKAQFSINGTWQSDRGFADPHSIFDNVSTSNEDYWSSSESLSRADFALAFDTGIGQQFDNEKNWFKAAWAITSGQVTAVPEPKSYFLILLGIGFIGITTRRSSNTKS